MSGMEEESFIWLFFKRLTSTFNEENKVGKRIVERGGTFLSYHDNLLRIYNLLF